MLVDVLADKLISKVVPSEEKPTSLTEFLTDSSLMKKRCIVMQREKVLKRNLSEFCGLTVKDFDMEKRIVQMLSGSFAVSGIMVNWNIRWTNDCSFRALLPEFSAHGVHLKEKKKPRKRAQNAALCGV